jgi:hypothetical protein
MNHKKGSIIVMFGDKDKSTTGPKGVIFHDKISEEQAREIAKQLGYEIISYWKALSGASISVPEGQEEEAIKQFKLHPLVLTAALNTVNRAIQ